MSFTKFVVAFSGVLFSFSCRGDTRNDSGNGARAFLQSPAREVAKREKSRSLEAQREALFDVLKRNLRLTPSELAKIRAIFRASPVIGQGNPVVTKHPMNRGDCLRKLKKAKALYENPDFEKICGARYMAPLYNPSREKVQAAKLCIDQFEFPNIPCEYPVVWVRAGEAAKICEAMGKRLCDAHEWEGACAGALHPPDYRFDLIKKGMNVGKIHKTLRQVHNRSRKVIWSYGPKQNHSLCGTSSTKGEECNRALSSGKGVWGTCGSNTYPVGAFPECKSPFDVYDIHGNAAEHMNLPFNPSELTKSGGWGYTEMKGSWFIFSRFSAHKDDCRWRAPYWHGSKVKVAHSHRNYHLGFRCCRDLQ